MLVQDGKISMSQTEFAQFQQITFAPWVPRTPEEFNAMCTLGIARHNADNTGGFPIIAVIACESIMFDPDGTAHFPSDQRRLAYMKVHGDWPTDEQLAEFEGLQSPKPGLQLVSN
jgi:hypothetical protein